MLSIAPLLIKIDKYILNPLLTLMFLVALAVFFWGIVQFISNSDASGTVREDGKRNILYGIIGMFIMVSAFGIIRVILLTFGIPNPPFIF